MKCISLHSGIPLRIFYGTKAGVLESGQLTTSIFNEVDKLQYRNRLQELFEKYVGEQNDN